MFVSGQMLLEVFRVDSGIPMASLQWAINPCVRERIDRGRMNSGGNPL